MADTPISERKPITLVCSECNTRIDYSIAPVTLADGSIVTGSLCEWHLVVCNYDQWAAGYAVVRVVCPECFPSYAGAFYVHLPTWLSP